MKIMLKLALCAVMALMLSVMHCSAAEAHGRVHVGGSVHVGGPYYGGYYGPYYDPWYDPWYPYPYGGRYYYAPPNHGWLWTQVEPNTAEVWVDGKLAGVVKDFDGPVNHLQLPVGSHEAQFRHPDYQTYTAGFEIYPGETASITYELRPLPRGEPGTDGRVERGIETGYGNLLIDVSPGGASIYVDGEYRATSTNEGGEIVVSAEAGSRQITVSREGYRDYMTDAVVAPGRDTRISVRLKER